MKNYQSYDLILAFFVAILLISNLTATKLVAFGPIITDGGALLFPLVYIFGDVLTEVYGYAYARRAIWAGFGVMILAAIAFTIVGYLPAAEAYENQPAYEAVLGFFPRIVLASLAAYLVGEFLNAFVLAKLKLRTSGKKLWLRLISSTAVGQLADTVIFALIAFGGILSSSEMLVFIAVGWSFKVGVEILLLPLTYKIIALLKRREGIEAYDKETSFSPGRLSLD